MNKFIENSLSGGRRLAAVAGVGCALALGPAKCGAQVVNGYWQPGVLFQQSSTTNGSTTGFNGQVTNLIVGASTYTNMTFRVNAIGQKAVTFEFNVQCLTNSFATSNIVWGVYANLSGNYAATTNQFYGYNGNGGVIGQYMSLVTNFTQSLAPTSLTNQVALCYIPTASMPPNSYLYVATINPQFTPTNILVRYSLSP